MAVQCQYFHVGPSEHGPTCTRAADVEVDFSADYECWVGYFCYDHASTVVRETHNESGGTVVAAIGKEI